MNLKKIFLTVAMSLSLASCTMGGGTPTKNQLFHDIADFLETRSVTIDGIPYIDSASDTAVVYSESIAGDDNFAPCFYFVIEGNVVNESLAALNAGEWTVPEKASEYGYECVNKQKTIEIDISYVETNDETNKIYAGTNYYVYAYADLNPDYNEGDGGDGEDTTSDVVVDNIIAFLKTRGVTVTSIPYFGDTKLTDVVYYKVEDGASGDYYPYFYVILEGDVVNAALQAFRAAGWTVPSQPDEEYGYECFNATKTVEIDILYVDPTDPENEGIGGTSFFVYSYADLSGEDGDNDETSDVVVDNIIAFLKTRGVTVTSIPYFGDTKLDDTVYYEVEDGATGDYYPCFYVVLEGDVVNAALQAFKTAGWTVPNQAGDYGYECVNAAETVEIDIQYLDPTDPENEGIGGTSFCVYAYDDLYGEGGDDDWDIDWNDPDAAIALAIATNIYGETDAEDNVGWFLFYYVMNTIDGNDLEAAVTVAARYLPDGFILVEAVEVETETDDETGESYDIAYGSYANTDGIVVEIDASLSEEEGKINVMYLIYLEDEDVFDEEPGDEEGDANVIQNEDGSYTATVDFSGFSNNSTYSGQKIGDLTIGVVMDTNTQNRPTYYTNGDSLRIYWGTGLSFSVSQGYELVKVEFTCTTGNDKTVDIDDSNLAVTGGTYSVNEKDVTITANQGVNELEMVLNLTKGNVAITGISVTYK